MWCLVHFLCYILPRRPHSVLAKRLVSSRNVVGCLRQKRRVRWFCFSFLTLLALCAILDAFFSSVCNAAIDVVGFLIRGCSVRSVSDSFFCLERCLGTRVFGAKLEENRDSYLTSQHKAHCVVIRGDWRGDSIQVLFSREFHGMMWKCVCEGFAYHRARNRAPRCTIRRLKLTDSGEHSFHGICASWFLHCLEILCIPRLLLMPITAMALITVLSFMACIALLVLTDYSAMDSTINFVCFSLFFGDPRQRCHFLFSVCNCVGFMKVPLRRCSISFFGPTFFPLEVFDVDPFGKDRSDHTNVRPAINN